MTKKNRYLSPLCSQLGTRLKAFGRSCSHRAFTLIEVMAAVMVLSIGVVSIFGLIPTLESAQVANREAGVVMEIGRLMGERLMGGQWNNLGRFNETQSPYWSNAWSWHRPYHTCTALVADTDQTSSTGNIIDNDSVAGIRPMTDASGTPDQHNLISLGLLSGVSGLQNLKVYLEYYDGTALDALFANASPATQASAWTTLASTSGGAILSEDATAFDLSQVKTAVIMRVLIRWTSSLGGTRQQEIILARRK